MSLTTHDNDNNDNDNDQLLFPSGRILNNMDNKIVNNSSNNFKLISPDAAIYLSSVIQHVTKELLQLSGNAAKHSNKTRIEPPHIQKAVKCDQEFGVFFQTRESKSRLSVPASPFDINDKNKTSSNLTFWKENDDDDDDDDDDDGKIEFDLIPGLIYIDDFLTNEQHDNIIKYFNNNEWNKRECRIIQEYIYSFNNNYLHRINKKPFNKMPICVENILNEIIMNKEYGIPNDYYFDQLIVNNYPNDGYIKYHIDSTHYFDEYIICLSFLSEVVMNFENVETNEIKQLLLKPKSLLILSGDARYKWKHGIKINRGNRMSLTFRRCKMQSINNNKIVSKIDCLLNLFNNN